MLNKLKNKVLLQYSGGKDSTACMLYMLDKNIKFEAIHFIHDYSYKLPTEQAINLCKQLKVSLKVIDITEKVEKLFLNNFKNRPCRYCKTIMDSFTTEYALNNGFDLICVGDTGSDSMLVNRIKNNCGSNITYSTYFNKNVTLPPTIKIYRPLITKSNEEVIKFVYDKLPDFKRINDTGDKYFEYSREGCPLQFKDFGVAYSKELMTNLKKLNLLCSEFATKKNIKASIHLPSEFIVTIPKGYEMECKKYIQEHGYEFKKEDKNCRENIFSYHIAVKIYDELRELDILKEALNRFIERIEFKSTELKLLDKNILSSSYDYNLYSNIMADTLFIYINSKIRVEQKKIENILLEIFHTNDYKINIERQ